MQAGRCLAAAPDLALNECYAPIVVASVSPGQKRLDSAWEARSPLSEEMGRGNGRVTSGPRGEYSVRFLQDSYSGSPFGRRPGRGPGGQITASGWGSAFVGSATQEKPGGCGSQPQLRESPYHHLFRCGENITGSERGSRNVSDLLHDSCRLAVGIERLLDHERPVVPGTRQEDPRLAHYASSPQLGHVPDDVDLALEAIHLRL